jgi:hypothetical protein
MDADEPRSPERLLQRGPSRADLVEPCREDVPAGVHALEAGALVDLQLVQL